MTIRSPKSGDVYYLVGLPPYQIITLIEQEDASIFLVLYDDGRASRHRTSLLERTIESGTTVFITGFE